MFTKARVVLFLVLLSLCVPAVVPADDFTDELSEALEEISADHYQPITAAFGNFTFEYTDLAGSFARYLQDRLTQAIGRVSRFSLFVHDALDNLDPAFSEIYGDLFSEEGVEAVLQAQYFDEGNRVRVTLRVDSLMTATMIGTTEVFVPKSAVPSGVDLAPADVEFAMQRQQELTDLVANESEDLVVRATLNKGSSAVYRDGERMTVSVYTNRDAYIKVYHIDVDGNTTLIFPNMFEADNFVPAQTIIDIPDRSHPFEFALHEPFGTEFIKVMASQTQFDDIEESFSGLGRASERVLTRGLSVRRLESGDVAETLVRYSIVER